jgi:hypothetical protein
MLINDLFRRTLCFEENSGAGGAAATEAASAAAEAAADGGGQGQATQTGGEAKAEGGEKTAEASKVAEVKLSEKLQRDLDRTTRALANLQKERDQLKEGKGSEKPAEKADGKPIQPKVDAPLDSSDPMKHPALKGLRRGEEDGTVIFRGAEVPAEFVIGLHDEREAIQSEINGLKGMQTQIEELRGLIDGDQTARSQAQLEQAQAALFDAAQTAVVEMREQALPNLPKEHTADVDEIILGTTDKFLTAALESGQKLSADLVAECAKKALDKARTLFGVFGAKQADGNSRYASEHPVKPDGQPGTHKPAEPKTRGERLREQEERTRIAEAKAEARA